MGGDGTDDLSGNVEPGMDAFREAMADVAPLSDRHQRKTPTAVRDSLSDAAKTERQQRALGVATTADPNPFNEGEVPQLDPRAVVAWKKDGVQREVFSKLRSGHYKVEADLDLHGLTVKEARTAVFKFIQMARAKGFRALLIAHGRGEKSQTPARLKSYLAYWLEHYEEVVAIHSAQRHHGGTGALYAMLKKSPEKKAETRERFGMQGTDPELDNE